MTYEQTVTLTTLISAAQGVSFTDDLKIKVWHSLLDDLDFETAHLAIKKLLRTETNHITPAHIRKVYGEIVEPNSDVSAAVALVFDTLRRYGRNGYKDGLKNIEAKDAIAFEIVKRIGYINLCNGDTDFTRPEFERLYRERASKVNKDKFMPESLLKQIEGFRANLEKKTVLELEAGDCY